MANLGQGNSRPYRRCPVCGQKIGVVFVSGTLGYQMCLTCFYFKAVDSDRFIEEDEDGDV